MGDELKPCPFCGSEPNVSLDNSYGACIVSCNECEAEPYIQRNKADILGAIAAWNLRTSPAPVPLEGKVEPHSEAMREALEQMVQEKCDYMHRNFLGDPELEHTIKAARAALAQFRDAASPDGEVERLRDITAEAQFLCDRLDSLEWCDLDQTTDDFYGHVVPPLARLKNMLAALQPQEPSNV